MNLGMESETLEFKKSTNELIDGVISISSMLNKHGKATLYFGVKNDGTIVGQKDINENTLRDISRKIAEGIKPQVIPTITMELVGDKSIIKVVVKGNQVYSAFDKYYLRSYDEDKKVTPDMLGQLINAKGEPDFIIDEPTLNTNLTFRILKNYFITSGHNVNEEQFEKNMNLLTNDGKYNYMANLLADVNDISIKVVTFAGKDKTVMLKRTEYGNKCLILAMNDVLEYLTVINETKVKLGGFKRIDENYFDFNCFKEAWINACVHTRWIERIPPAVYIFDDRIEIVSNGGLPKALNKEDFFQGVSKPVNSELLKIFMNLDIIDQTGHGVPLIIEKYGKDAFYISDNTIIVTIPMNKELLEKSYEIEKTNDYIDLNENEIKVINVMKSNPKVNTKELIEILNISEGYVEKIIKKLKQEDYIVREGSNKTGSWKVLK